MRLILSSTVLAILLAGACADETHDTEVPPTTAEATEVELDTTFAARGVVTSVVANKRHVMIRHDEIPGFMDAMTMPFSVRDTSLVSGIERGDSVHFDVRVFGSEIYIDELEEVGGE